MKLNRDDILPPFNYSNYYVLMSFFGLIFLVLIYLWSPPTKTVYQFQKPLIFLAFMGICLSGMLAAVFPSRCKGITRFSRKSGKYQLNKKPKKNENDGLNKEPKLDPELVIRFEGHHPDCGKFESHTIHFKGKKYCPGCTGLLVGAVLAVTGTIFYYFRGLGLIYGQISFWIGVVTVFTSLILILYLNLDKNIIKLVSNITLVIGSLLILVGIDTVKKNIIMEFYFLILVLFWIRARITVSKINHESICNQCSEKSHCIDN